MSLICPACRKIYLKPQVDFHSNLEIDICPKCYGMWFDGQELSKFLQSDVLKRKFLLGEDAAPDLSTAYVMSTKTRACPRCGKAMGEKLFGSVSVDICDICKGIWLDDGELQRIINQYEKGERGEKDLTKELSKGLKGKMERPSLGEVLGVLRAFFTGK